MSDIIKEKYLKKAVIYDNIWMYFIKDAIQIVIDCKKNNIQITAIEAFKLSGEGIQPSQENSAEISTGIDNWNDAISFLSNIQNTSYLYEIWYDGY